MDSVDINSFETLRDIAESYARLGDRYVCAKVTHTITDTHPFRFSGYTVILSVSGTTHLEINTHTIILPPSNITLLPPGTVIRNLTSPGTPYSTWVLLISPEFIRDIRIDLAAISDTTPRNHETYPILPLTPEDAKIIQGYLTMLTLTAQAHTSPHQSIFTSNISTNLLAALIYSLIEISSRDTSPGNPADTATPDIRRAAYLRRFMELVRVHYTTQRTVSYYAGRLGITPKYLSAIIRQTTGRSAAQWISRSVILEAKNLLRFSGMTVQQVAYTLNFKNQSAFGKYFKHLTGLSPTEFQKG